MSNSDRQARIEALEAEREQARQELLAKAAKERSHNLAKERLGQMADRMERQVRAGR